MDRSTWVKVFANDWQGLVHGTDSTGAMDIEFPSMSAAVGFTDFLSSPRVQEERGITKADIRKGDSVTSLHKPVVITVRFQ